MSSTLEKFPRKILVHELVSSRYSDASGFSPQRPENWDNRIDGIDTVRDDSGSVIKLRSSGMQSPPRKGSALMLLSGDAQSGFNWTLYGLPRNA